MRQRIRSMGAGTTGRIMAMGMAMDRIMAMGIAMGRISGTVIGAMEAGEAIGAMEATAVIGVAEATEDSMVDTKKSGKVPPRGNKIIPG